MTEIKQSKTINPGIVVQSKSVINNDRNHQFPLNIDFITVRRGMALYYSKAGLYKKCERNAFNDIYGEEYTKSLNLAKRTPSPLSAGNE